jgi:hypothetical protein
VPRVLGVLGVLGVAGFDNEVIFLSTVTCCYVVRLTKKIKIFLKISNPKRPNNHVEKFYQSHHPKHQQK